MMKWILPGIAVLIAGAIAWPYLFGNTTIEVKGKIFQVEHRTADSGSSSRHFPIRDRVALAPDQAILCSWDRDRYLYYWSDGCRAGFDVAYLDAAGKILQTGRIRPVKDPMKYLEDPGVASETEARHALFLMEGSIDNLGLTPGTAVALSADLTAAPEAMTTVTVGGKTVRVVVSESSRDRARGLMHRPKMSKDEGMLFLYPKERSEPRLNFYMKNTLMSLDISFFTAAGKLVNVVSTSRAPNPADGASINATASGPAQYVLEMPIGWYKENGLVDDKGKAVKEIPLEPADDVKKRAAKAEQ